MDRLKGFEPKPNLPLTQALMDIKEEDHKPDESSLPTEAEISERLADGEGETFPNAREAIRWLGTPITKEVYCSPADGGRLLTEEEIFKIVYGYMPTKEDRESGIAQYLSQSSFRVAKAQRDLTVSIKDAENRERGLLLRSKVGGIDEINDWSEEGLRRFREEILPVIRDHYEFLIKGEEDGI